MHMRRVIERGKKFLLFVIIGVMVIVPSVPVTASYGHITSKYLNYNPMSRTITKPKKIKVVDIRKTKIVYMHSTEKLRFTAGGKATWKSGRKSVVSVNQNGVITVKDYGLYKDASFESRYDSEYDVRITAKRNGKTYSCIVRAFPLTLDTTGYLFSSVNCTEFIPILSHGAELADPPGYKEDGLTVGEWGAPVYAPEKISISAKSSNTSVIKITTPKGSSRGIACKVKKAGSSMITVTIKTPAGYKHVFKQKVITTSKKEEAYLESLKKEWLKKNHKNLTEDQVYNKIMEFAKKKYPEGSKWTASTPYVKTRGSVAFANMLSDYIFGDQYIEIDEIYGIDDNIGVLQLVQDEPVTFWTPWEYKFNYYDSPNNPSYVGSRDDLRVGDIIMLSDPENPDELDRCVVLIRKEMIDEYSARYYVAEGDVNRKVTYQEVLTEQDMDELFYLGVTRY